MNLNLDDPVTEVGAKFKNLQQLRFCLQQHVIRRNFNYDLDKNDLKRVVIKCLEEGWVVAGN